MTSHQLPIIDDITTIFVVGFPDDIQEREFQNIFMFSKGFEAATLKIPSINELEDGSIFNNGRKQIIGFAKFKSRQEAIEAKDFLNGRRIDTEKGCILKSEMAKKNLHTKRMMGISTNDLLGGIPIMSNTSSNNSIFTNVLQRRSSSKEPNPSNSSNYYNDNFSYSTNYGLQSTSNNNSSSTSNRDFFYSGQEYSMDNANVYNLADDTISVGSTRNINDYGIISGPFNDNNSSALAIPNSSVDSFNANNNSNDITSSFGQSPSMLKSYSLSSDRGFSFALYNSDSLFRYSNERSNNNNLTSTTNNNVNSITGSPVKNSQSISFNNSLTPLNNSTLDNHSRESSLSLSLAKIEADQKKKEQNGLLIDDIQNINITETSTAITTLNNNENENENKNENENESEKDADNNNLEFSEIRTVLQESLQNEDNNNNNNNNNNNSSSKPPIQERTSSSITLLDDNSGVSTPNQVLENNSSTNSSNSSVTSNNNTVKSTSIIKKDTKDSLPLPVNKARSFSFPQTPRFNLDKEFDYDLGLKDNTFDNMILSITNDIDEDEDEVSRTFSAMNIDDKSINQNNNSIFNSNSNNNNGSSHSLFSSSVGSSQYSNLMSFRTSNPELLSNSNNNNGNSLCVKPPARAVSMGPNGYHSATSTTTSSSIPPITPATSSIKMNNISLNKSTSNPGASQSPSTSLTPSSNSTAVQSASSLNSLQLIPGGTLSLATIQMHMSMNGINITGNDQNPPCNTLYIGNLPNDTNEDELRQLFQVCIGYKRLCFKTRVGSPMCFVEFDDVVYATKALCEMYGTMLSNSTRGGIRLSFSKNPLGVRLNNNNGNNNNSNPLLMASNSSPNMLTKAASSLGLMGHSTQDDISSYYGYKNMTQQSHGDLYDTSNYTISNMTNNRITINGNNNTMNHLNQTHQQSNIDLSNLSGEIRSNNLINNSKSSSTSYYSMINNPSIEVPVINSSLNGTTAPAAGY